MKRFLKSALVLVFIILILLLVYVKKEGFVDAPSAPVPIELVISRYNEDLSWLDTPPFNKYPAIVYNKGNNTDYYNKTVRRSVRLPNVGKCDHTYLYHIIHNYDKLADVTIFLPGSADNPGKIWKTREIVNTVENHKDTVIIGSATEGGVGKYLYNFTLDEWKTSDERNSDAPISMEKAIVRPFGKWFESKFGDLRVDYVTYSGILAFSRKDIIQHSKEYYQSFLDELESPNPEVGHYIERAWLAIFHPLHNPLFMQDKRY